MTYVGVDGFRAGRFRIALDEAGSWSFAIYLIKTGRANSSITSDHTALPRNEDLGQLWARRHYLPLFYL